MRRAWFLGILLLAGCAPPVPEPEVGLPERPTYTPSEEPFADRVVTTDPEFPTPAWLSNGLIGLRVGRSGFSEGEATPAFALDAYEAGGEEKILPLPNPLGVRIDNPKAAEPTEYDQQQLFDGRLITRYVQGGIRVSVVARVHPDLPVVALRAVFEAPAALGAQLIQEMDQDLPGGGRWEVVSSHGAGPEPLSGSVRLDRVVAYRGPGAAPFAVPTVDQVLEAPGFGGFQLEIEGPMDDQQAVNSFVYYLRSAIHPSAGHAVSPLALSGTTYFGHVFWDADLWVFPALALIDPARAATIPRYRLAKLQGAQDNFAAWQAAGYPTVDGPRTPDPQWAAMAPAPGLKFPWESSVTGRETVPGPSRFQDHITGTVVWSMQMANALGMVATPDLERVGQGAATFWLHRMDRGQDGLARIAGTMSPDEHFTGDNDLYTNLVADWTLRRFLGPERWPEGRMFLPQDEVGFLTYEGDRLKGYKQAAAVLAIYPLQHPEAERQARTMLERFEPGVIPNGPAMTDSIHALLHARLGDRERAYEEWRTSWQAFTAHPLLMFSEKRSKEVTYFTTGAAGCLQTVLYGFLGLRLDPTEPQDVAWKAPLREGWWISARPNLPPAWNRVTVRGLALPSGPVDLVFERETVTASAP